MVRDSANTEYRILLMIRSRKSYLFALTNQIIWLFLFNESEDFSSNNEMVEISIPPINFDRHEYESLSIFIYYCPDVLALTKMDESDINKEFINLK
jgi:hypothetical protein